MADERDARSVASDGADVVVAWVVVDLRRVLVARARAAERRMDDVRDAGDGLRDRRAGRDEHLGRIDADRTPVERRRVRRAGADRPRAAGRPFGEDAVHRSYRTGRGRRAGERQPVIRLVARERAGNQAEQGAVAGADAAASPSRGIAAERRIDEERPHAVSEQPHRAAADGGGIARERAGAHGKIGIGRRGQRDRAAGAGRAVSDERARVDVNGRAVDAD